MREVTLIGGEAYLREDWLEIVRAIRAHGMTPTMTTGGRGLDAERARAAQAGRPAQRERLDRRARPRRTIGCAASTARTRARSRRSTHLRAAGIPVSANTQINRLSMPELPRGARADRERTARTAGRSSSPCRWAAPPTSPRCCSSRTSCSSCSRCSRSCATRCDELGVLHAARQQHRLLRSVRAALRGYTPARPRRLVRRRAARRSASRPTARSRAARRCRPQAWSGGNVRDALAARHLGARRAAALHARPHGRGSLGLLPRLLLRRRVPRRLHVDEHVLFGKPGNNPYCHHRALELAARGQARAPRAARAPPGVPFDHGRFELIVEDLPRPAGTKGEKERTEDRCLAYA